MNTVSSNHESRAVVIAGKYESSKVEVVHFLARRGIEVTFCDSLYAAAGELSHAVADGKILVVGGLAELSREAGRFFQICSKRPEVTCLCFIRAEAEQRKRIGAAVRWGALVVSDMEDFEQAVQEWSKGWTGRQERVSSSKATGKRPTREELNVSQAELEALLEGG